GGAAGALPRPVPRALGRPQRALVDRAGRPRHRGLRRLIHAARPDDFVRDPRLPWGRDPARGHEPAGRGLPELPGRARDRPYGDRAVQVRVRSLSPVAERKRRGPAATPGLVLLLARAGCEWCRALRARREQLLRMRGRRLALRVAAEQAGKLRNARLAGEILDDRRRARVPLLLPYEQVMLRTGRDLRQVGDDKDLAVARHVAQRIADGV